MDLEPEAGAVVQDTEKEEAASDLARALAHSRAEAEALPLSRDGVTLFRLTRNHRSSEVVSLLMNPKGALAHLREGARVRELEDGSERWRRRCISSRARRKRLRVPRGEENCSDGTAKPIGLDELGIWELVEPLRRSRPSSLTVAWTASAQEFRQAGGERGA